MNDLLGKQLGNYRVIRLLGQGGFADVYLGEHIYLQTQAAIKVLNARLANDDLEDFLNEARTISSLVHPHIVRVLEFGVEGNTPFLVMDYALNGTLQQKHPRGKRLQPSTIIPYVTQVATALLYAHEKRLIHRDVKPENMLLNQNNEVLLSDFGIALLSQSSRYQSTQDVVGTIAYMAPEQFLGKPTAASDQYALAIVVFEWLSGDRPFHGSFAEVASQHMLAPVPHLADSVPGLPSSIDDVLQLALAKNPQERFVRVDAFASALAQAAGLTRAAQPAPPLVSVLPDQETVSDISTRVSNAGTAEQSLTTWPVSPDDLASSTSIVNQPGQANDSIGSKSQADSVQIGATPSQSLTVDRSQTSRKGISRRTVVFGLAGLVAVAAATGGAAIASMTFLHQPNVSPKTLASTGSSQNTATTGNTLVAPTDTPTTAPTATTTPVATETATANASTPTSTATMVPTGTVLYTADWTSGLNGWVGSSAWKVSEGQLLSDGTQFDNGIVETLITCPYQTGTISDYAVEAVIQVLRKGGGGYTGSMGLFIRGDGQNDGYWLGDSTFSQAFIGASSSGGYTTLKTVSYSPDLNVHTYRVEAKSNVLTLLIDGGKYISVTDNTYISGGQVGIFAENDEIEVKSFNVTAL